MNTSAEIIKQYFEMGWSAKKMKVVNPSPDSTGGAMVAALGKSN